MLIIAIACYLFAIILIVINKSVDDDAVIVRLFIVIFLSRMFVVIGEFDLDFRC